MQYKFKQSFMNLQNLRNAGLFAIIENDKISTIFINFGRALVF